MGAPAKRNKKLVRRTGDQLMRAQIAIDEQNDKVGKKKAAAAMYMRDTELTKQEEWDRTHQCEVHHLTLSVTGKCVMCGMFGGPHK